jgi:hypothetical protein
MNTLFKSSSSYASLSLKDLLETRELFHYHLLSKKNVVATAVGLYRIRKEDPWPSKKKPKGDTSQAQKPRRTLFNSEIRPYSWPCIYVFVSDWEAEVQLSKENPSDVVPKTLYLPDGRTVPVCVIEARKQSYSDDLDINTKNLYPRNYLAPGVPILNDHAQGLRRLATVGCIVRDGENYYALTNKHAAGAEGTKINALKGYCETEIGVTSSKGITRKLFKEVYPHFSSSYQYLLMDIGLIKIEDITRWKTEVSGIEPTENVLDLYDNSFTLQLIGQKVVGLSAVTGKIRGEIHGLFYRYKALGGYEYLSDFLIGPETWGANAKRVKESDDKNVGLKIHHGDSGTLLFIEHKVTEDEEGNGEKGADEKAGEDNKKCVYYPFALLWGKHEFIEDRERNVQPFALATSLSTVLDELELDYVRDINLDNDFVWGYVGHYAIGDLLPYAVELLESKKLKKFIDNNYSLLTLDDIVGNDPKVLVKDADGNYNVDDPNFVPLADVPDNVWKSNVNFYQEIGDDNQKHRKGGPGSRGQNDNPNHFADVDLPYQGFETFLEFNLDDLDTRLKPEVWLEYYKSLKPRYAAWAEALGKKGEPEYKHWGALPFRVWQLFEAMKSSAQGGKQDEFLCAGGVLIHYMGDTCQPLHSSYLSQGDPDDLIEKPQAGGMKIRAEGVHGGYEDDMIEYGYTKMDLMAELKKEIKRQEGVKKEKIDNIETGLDAAKAVLYLIAATQGTIPPREIVDKWVELKSIHSKEMKKADMWEAFGKRTIECMARGCRYLAKIWQGAWDAGDGDHKIGEGKKLKPQAIMDLYNDPDVVRSIRLDKYEF